MLDANADRPDRARVVPGDDMPPVDAAGSDAPGRRAAGASAAVLRWTAATLVATVWLSATLFGLYILAFYAASLAAGEPAAWNQILPGLYGADRPVATAGIGLHFAAGGTILVLGCIQLIG